VLQQASVLLALFLPSDWLLRTPSVLCVSNLGELAPERSSTLTYDKVGRALDVVEAAVSLIGHVSWSRTISSINRLPRSESYIALLTQIIDEAEALHLGPPEPGGSSGQQQMLASINSLFCAIKFPVPISRELSCNQLILLRSVGHLLAKRPNFCKIPCYFPC